MITELKKGNKYLVKSKVSSSNKIIKIDVLDVTKSCFEIYEMPDNRFWIEKQDFYLKYKILEEIISEQFLMTDYLYK